MPEELVPQLPWYKRFWEGVKLWSWKFVGALFFEEKKDGHLALSLGRTGFIFVLGWMAYYWADWSGAQALEATDIASLIVAQLPEGANITGVDVIAAADKIVAALPRTAEPPLLQTAFLTMAGYVLGSKGVAMLNHRFNGRQPK